MDAAGRGPAELGYEILVPVEGYPATVEGCPAACIRLVLSGAYKGQYLLASFKKLGSDGKWAVIDGCDYTSVYDHYAHFTENVMAQILVNLNALGTAMAANYVKLVASYVVREISSRSILGTVVLAFDVTLASQSAPTQRAIFEITVNEQTDEKNIMVRFADTGEYSKAKYTYNLASDMTCFTNAYPLVAIETDDDTGLPVNPDLPVFHPTFHQWIVSTFCGQPGFVQADHYTVRDFIYYMRYMALYPPTADDFYPVQR